METKSVYVEYINGELKAWIKVEIPERSEQLRYKIHDATTLEPYWILGEAKYKLKANEFKALRKALREVDYEGRKSDGKKR